MTRGNRNGYWGTGESFCGGGIGKDMSGDATGTSGVGDVLGGLK